MEKHRLRKRLDWTKKVDILLKKQKNFKFFLNEKIEKMLTELQETRI